MIIWFYFTVHIVHVMHIFYNRIQNHADPYTKSQNGMYILLRETYITQHFGATL